MTLFHSRLLFVALVVATSLAGQQEEADKLMADARRRLLAIGYTVPAGVVTSTRQAAEVIADLDAQQDLLLPRGAFALQHALFSALGLQAGKDETVLRRQFIASMARGLAAYYDSVRKTFVLLPSATRSVVEAVSGSTLPLVVHELVHACQDAREGGVAAFFAAEQGSLDVMLARRCVLEGEAEIAAVVALKGETAVRGLVHDQGRLDKLFAGELTGQIYQIGRCLVAGRFVESGWPGVAALWRTPPSSTEQVMHPDKLGKDLPTAIDVPRLPGCTRLQATTFGELMIYHALRQLGRDTKSAALAATGWDGDQLALLQDEASKSRVVAWRSVWDREQDAAAFAAALPQRPHARLAVQGRIVDWLSADGVDEQRFEQLFAALRAAVPELPDDPEAAASTAAAEERLLAEAAQTSVSGGRWRHDAVGLSLPVPEGYELREVKGTQMLVLPETAKQGFLVNVQVAVRSRDDLADIAALLAANRKQLEAIEGLTVDQLAAGKLGEVEVVHCEIHGRIGTLQPIHCLQVLYLRGDQQVIVTATASPSQWRRLEPDLRALVAGIVIAP